MSVWSRIIVRCKSQPTLTVPAHLYHRAAYPQASMMRSLSDLLGMPGVPSAESAHRLSRLTSVPEPHVAQEDPAVLAGHLEWGTVLPSLLYHLGRDVHLWFRVGFIVVYRREQVGARPNLWKIRL